MRSNWGLSSNKPVRPQPAPSKRSTSGSRSSKPSLRQRNTKRAPRRMTRQNALPKSYASRTSSIARPSTPRRPQQSAKAAADDRVAALEAQLQTAHRRRRHRRRRPPSAPRHLNRRSRQAPRPRRAAPRPNWSKHVPPLPTRQSVRATGSPNSRHSSKKHNTTPTAPTPEPPTPAPRSTASRNNSISKPNRPPRAPPHSKPNSNSTPTPPPPPPPTSKRSSTSQPPKPPNTAAAPSNSRRRSIRPTPISIRPASRPPAQTQPL